MLRNRANIIFYDCVQEIKMWILPYLHNVETIETAVKIVLKIQFNKNMNNIHVNNV